MTTVPLPPPCFYDSVAATTRERQASLHSAYHSLSYEHQWKKYQESQPEPVSITSLAWIELPQPTGSGPILVAGSAEGSISLWDFGGSSRDGNGFNEEVGVVEETPTPEQSTSWILPVATLTPDSTHPTGSSIQSLCWNSVTQVLFVGGRGGVWGYPWSTALAPLFRDRSLPPIQPEHPFFVPMHRSVVPMEVMDLILTIVEDQFYLWAATNDPFGNYVWEFQQETNECKLVSTFGVPSLRIYEEALEGSIHSIVTLTASGISLWDPVPLLRRQQHQQPAPRSVLLVHDLLQGMQKESNSSKASHQLSSLAIRDATWWVLGGKTTGGNRNGATTEGWVFIWHVPTQTVLHRISTLAHTQRLLMSIAGQQQLLLTTGNDGQLRVYPDGGLMLLQESTAVVVCPGLRSGFAIASHDSWIAVAGRGDGGIHLLQSKNSTNPALLSLEHTLRVR